MAGRLDLDLYNVLLGFGWARERVELTRATIDPGFLLRARRALFPLPGIDRAQAPPTDVLAPFRRTTLALEVFRPRRRAGRQAPNGRPTQLTPASRRQP
jgi:hypothetical protein